MPLTVDEVGTAAGLARSGSPAATTRPAGPLRAAGKPWRPNLEVGGGGGRGFAVPTGLSGGGKAAWGWGGRVQVGSSGTLRIRLLGITMLHREMLRPLPPIKRMHRESPTGAQACSAAGVSRVLRRGGSHCPHAPFTRWA